MVASIINPKERCNCGHWKMQHALGADVCDNCDCSKYNKDTSVDYSDVDELKGAMCVALEAADPTHNSDTGWRETDPLNATLESAAEQRGAADSKPIFVGTEWHEFHGVWGLCDGVLGYGPGDPRTKVCNQSRNAPIHSNERKPEWMKDKDKVLIDSGLKDSGQRLQFASGMVRDVEEDKPGFHFLLAKNVPIENQMITRVATHLRKGAKKYAPRNWEKGDSYEEAERAKESALRHMMQWFNGETDEDHAAATIINVIFAETMKYKADNKKED